MSSEHNTEFVDKAEESSDPVRYVIDQWGDPDWHEANLSDVLLLVFKLLRDRTESNGRF